MKRFSQSGNSPNPKQFFCENSSDESGDNFDYHVPSSPPNPKNLFGDSASEESNDNYNFQLPSSPATDKFPILSQASSDFSWTDFNFAGLSGSESDSNDIGKSSKIQFKLNQVSIQYFLRPL